MVAEGAVQITSRAESALDFAGGSRRRPAGRRAAFPTNMARTRYQSLQQEVPLRALPAAALRAVLGEGYGAATFKADLMAGLVVGIVALPLAMALAIAVGVAPQHGLYTAIVAGLAIALLGGSRTQVSGPTAAFVVILAPIYARFGLAGLTLAGLLAGLLLVGMGLLRMGKLIEFIPHPVTTGFTAGIATVIAVLQVKDLLGLRLGHTPEHFAERVVAFARAGPSASPWELGVGLFTLALLLLVPRLTRRVPAPLVALPSAALLAVALYRLAGAQVATIASRFHSEVAGRTVAGIPPLPPLPILPWLAPGPAGEPLALDLHTLRALLPSAFAIAMLGAIESLLSAVVADGMARTRHDPDAELLAQGVGNVVAPFFGGIPATGAIARTATNIRSGARTPVAAAVHALTVLAAVLALAPALGYLPMSALAALLVLVAWNMSEVKHFAHTVRVAPRSDVAVLLTCYGLTVFTDMVIGVSVGMVLAAMLFMRRMAIVTEAKLVETAHPDLPGPVPPGVVVYRVSGPLFFGAAQKAMAALNAISDRARVVILWLEQVPVLDATGLVALESALAQLGSRGVTAVLLGLQVQPRGLVERTDLLKRPGVLASGDAAEALRIAGEIAAQGAGGLGSIPARLTAGDVMRRDVTSVSKDAPLREVVESMLLHGHRSLPVVERGAPVGIITNGDLVQRGGLGVRLELLRGMAWPDVRAELDALGGAARTAADVMTPSPVTVGAGTSLRRVAQLMARRRLKRLPVVDGRGALAGMLSRVDLLRAAAGLARAGEEVARTAGLGGGATVAQVMRRDVPAVLPDMPLPEVLQAVISTRLNKALVVDGERRVLGLVTDEELVDRMTRAVRPGLLRSLMLRVPFAHVAPEDLLAAQHARARSARDLMVTGVPTVTLDTPIGDATAAMLAADRKILAVVDADGRLLGIVDRADLLRGLATSAAWPEGAGTPAPGAS
jgi:SulP family sulfate permease